MARSTIEVMQWLVFSTSLLHYSNFEIHVIDHQSEQCIVRHSTWLNWLNSWMRAITSINACFATLSPTGIEHSDWLIQFQIYLFLSSCCSRTEPFVHVNNPNYHASAVCIVYVHRFFWPCLIAFYSANLWFTIFDFIACNYNLQFTTYNLQFNYNQLNIDNGILLTLDRLDLSDVEHPVYIRLYL